MVGDTIYILEQGEAIIKSDFLRDSAYGGAHTEYVQNALVLVLQKELEMKNNQIAELNALLKIQAMKPQKKRALQGKAKSKTIKRSVPITRLINR